MSAQQINHVAILLGTRDGAEYLPAQLGSFEHQTHHNWSLWASDDGSTDGTQEIIADFIDRAGVNGRLVNGPQQGVCANFMSLVVNPEIQANYYAFADQDDVWSDDKLARAVNWLKAIDADIPAVYCSRTQLIDSNGTPVGYSPGYAKAPGFGNALLQNIASGNTMVFNHRARMLLSKASLAPMVIHDWSLYQIVTGCGGVVHYDPQPTVLYRQHSHNVIGNSMAPWVRLRNFIAAHDGRAATWNDQNWQVLNCVSDDLTPQAKRSLEAFRRIRNSGLLGRLRLMRESGIYHQQLLGSVTTLTYVLLNKI
ncbi:glycosyltransferase involved in cell wall biosynthesis [Gibbsiella quercinecans]|uniref:Glycosyl transferase n=1 Tax=Gibbsiella quercinecans TaxID=929813 RepID=A0A250AXP7_9GAMM|nr:glycosyltransferase family 2 protein [Gibbsiella quercinecans]ATA18596.1 glycosyl transferase [Gibbsiella quercinecans]RLM03490.1 glycosyl transferase [Gibbsiella quercinecans]TCT81816.1 glycosyltransferase involved in cell wall biosynthesis [Gibbsiella quercinecans]